MTLKRVNLRKKKERKKEEGKKETRREGEDNKNNHDIFTSTKMREREEIPTPFIKSLLDACQCGRILTADTPKKLEMKGDMSSEEMK